MVDRLFHKTGLAYFWVLNDECRAGTLDAMLEAFVAAGVTAVIPHPRAGLLLPYGGTDWFDTIERIVDRCAARGLAVWLYDEDPFPSGNAGGWVTAGHPEREARAIQRFGFDPDRSRDGLFGFPIGELLWCGWVRESDGATIDQTDRVGIVRRDWELLEPWDSRWYYPNTPLYDCPRGRTRHPEFALRVDVVPAGFTLQAFVAQPVGRDSDWGALPDTLNPAVTEEFLARTHERYWQRLGRHFGQAIPAIFTDEPKCHGDYPWTPGLCEDFARRYGYDLRPRLWRLFAAATDAVSQLTRIHYREWCGDRFRTAWLELVRQWCANHGLALVGHISPEDDPVQQVACVNNLLPLLPQFTLPGIDLIVPAVGDHDHPLLNLGVIAATSIAQQQDRPGVLSESLAASGLDFPVAEAGRILRWQTMMGVTTPVVHAAYNSVAGPRLKDAPPDFGPFSPRWPAMVALGHELAEWQAVIRDAQQIAPVAILWPIRSFAAQPFTAYTHESPLRDQFVQLVHTCLDRQVGVHILDEAALWSAAVRHGAVALGRARYAHIVVPPCLVLHEKTITALAAAARAGVDVRQAGTGPAWQETADCVTPCAVTWPTLGDLPRLLDLQGDPTDIRCTGWQSGTHRTLLLMNLAKEPRSLKVDGRELTLLPAELRKVILPA